MKYFWIKILLFGVFTSAYISTVALAQTRLVIEGPEDVSPCDLVRLDVQLAENESALWIVEPDTLDYEIVDNRLLFSLGCVKEARVLVIAASVDEGVVRFRQVKHRVRAGQGAQPPPTQPVPADPPGEQPDKPDQDWSSLTVWIAAHDTPANDPETARSWAQQLNLASVAMAGKSIEQAQAIVGDVRRNLFVQRRQSKTDWNPFLLELDKRIKSEPPGNVANYIGLVKAVAKGLEQ